MIFDELGLPKEIGATDLQDSSRLAGIMTVFEWPQHIDLSQYVQNNSYVRHPKEYIYDFSRDQAICLMAGLAKQGLTHLVARKFITGRDILAPHHRGHVKNCSGGRSNWFEDLWLKMDIIYGAKFDPMGEPNKRLCILMSHPDKKYLTFYLKHNILWREAILEYWGLWREERELGLHIISKLESYVENRGL